MENTRQTPKEKIYYILATLILIGVSLYFFQKYKSNVELVSVIPKIQSEESNLLLTQGKVISIDPAKNELVITLRSADEVAGAKDVFKGKEKIVKITQDTVIQKLIVSKDAQGVIIKSASFEINISDLHKNDKVSLVYGVEKDNLLENVKTVSFMVESKSFEETIKVESLKLQNDPYLYIKGQVVSVDISKAIVEYLPYVFDQVGIEKSLAILQAGAKIYTVNDAARVHIEHSRKEVLLGDIKRGDTIFVVVDKNVNLSQKTISAEAIVFMSKK